MLLPFLIFSVHLSGQEIITLEYDNSGLDYREPEIKTKGYSNDNTNKISPFQLYRFFT